MNKEIMEEYIKFWTDNWFKINDNWHTFYTLESIMAHNFTETITSKNFIEAIARGVDRIPGKNFPECLSEHISIKDYITCTQAIAIRNETLEEFIKIIIINDN